MAHKEEAVGILFKSDNKWSGNCPYVNSAYWVVR
jgi:hypothetical protein